MSITKTEANELTQNVLSDDAEKIVDLVKRGENLSDELMNAIINWEFDFALSLIRYGVDVNYLGKYSGGWRKQNALMLLLQHTCDTDNLQRQSKVFEALLEAGADPNHISEGKSVIFCVLNRRNAAKHLLPILLKYPINMKKDTHGDTPIRVALGFYDISSVLMMIDKMDLSKDGEIKELFDLFAQFGCTQGLQKLYNLVGSSKIISEKISAIMTETFAKIGKFEGSIVFAKLFGHNRKHFYERHGFDSVIQTVKWFLKYMDFEPVISDIDRRETILSNNLTSGMSESNLKKFLDLNLKTERIIANIMKEELITRIEVEKQVEKPVVKLEDLYNESMCMFQDKKGFLDFIQSKEIRNKRSGFWPYWTMAERNKESSAECNKKSSNSKFSKLSQPLKVKIMTFLEPAPLAVSMERSYYQSLNNRLNSIQEKVTQREREKEKEKENEREKEKQKIEKNKI